MLLLVVRLVGGLLHWISLILRPWYDINFYCDASVNSSFHSVQDELTLDYWLELRIFELSINVLLLAGSGASLWMLRLISYVYNRFVDDFFREKFIFRLFNNHVLHIRHLFSYSKHQKDHVNGILCLYICCYDIDHHR